MNAWVGGVLCARVVTSTRPHANGPHPAIAHTHTHALSLSLFKERALGLLQAAVELAFSAPVPLPHDPLASFENFWDRRVGP